MKRFLCIIMAILIVLPTLGTAVSAYDISSSFISVETDFGEVYFNRDYAEIGKDITVLVSGRENENFLYKWYVDGLLIAETSDTYTILDCDLQSMIEAEVYDFDGQLVGKKSMFVSTLPVVYIETKDRAPIISKENYLDAEIKIQGNAEFNDAGELYDGVAEIRGRGNATWNAVKKPYRIKLDSKSDLFGMGKSKHWVLLSNPFDTSLLRNTISYNFSSDLGLEFQKSVWVDVVLNGTVVGNYQLCEHIRVDDNRVEITNWEDVAEDAAKAIYNGNKNTLTKDDRDAIIDIMVEDMSWTTSDTVVYKDVSYAVSDYFEYPDINGGYLLEVVRDNTKPNFTTTNGTPVCIDTPETLSDDMFNEIKGYYQAFEDALFSDDFCTVYNGKKVRYTDLIDLDSFVKGILINEMFENADFGRKSTWMSKEIDGKIIFGPIWDMDYTTSSSSFYRWQTHSVNWLARFFTDPVFLDEFRTIYFEHRYTDIHDIIRDGGDIDTAIQKIQSSAEYNDAIWKNAISFAENARDFKLRLQAKINWLDTTLANTEAVCTSVGCNYEKYKELNSDLLDISLSITTLPDKLTYNAGEAVDLTGLVLKAMNSKGEITTVTPDLVYTYVKDSLGEQNYAYNKITEEIGNTYVVLCYKNAKIQFKVNVNPRENYEEIEALIDNLPKKLSGNRFVREMFEAQIGYDALSETAKEKVMNADKLATLMANFEASVADNDLSVVSAFSDGVIHLNSRSPVVTVSKDVPRKILYIGANGSTSTYTEESGAYVSQKTVGNFSLTTIKTLIASDETLNYGIKALYNDNRKSSTYETSVTRLNDEMKIINNISYNKHLNSGEDLSVTVNKDSDALSLRLTENGTNLGATSKTNALGVTLTKTLTQVGKHTITVEYLHGSGWFGYRNIDVTVREAFPTDGKIYGIDYPAETYQKTIDVCVASSKNFNKMLLVGGGANVQMTYTDNGEYRIWKATVDISDGKTYALWADGQKTDYTVKCTLLNPFEIVGTKIVRFLADTDIAVIPEYITEIADDAFDGFEGTIHCYPNSVGKTYAQQHGIKFKTFALTVNTKQPTLKPGESTNIKIIAFPYTPEDFVLKAEYDKSIVSFNNGKLTGLKPGYTRLNLSSEGGLWKETVLVYVGGGVTLGDLNADGKINSIDSLIVLNANVEKIVLDEEQKAAADINRDGKVNSIDALILLQIATEYRSVWDYIK